MRAYCDSSYDDKRKTAGIGVIIENGSERRVYSNWLPARSNNEGELFAIYVSVILMNGRGTIYTDSQTAISYIKGEIKEDKSRGRDQWLNHMYCKFWAYRIRNLMVKDENGRCLLNIDKVKAHQHNYHTHSIGNRLADLLAKEGRAKFYGR